MQMRMEMTLRLEQHDAQCDRCGEDKPSNRECGSCAIENAKLASIGESGIGRTIDEHEAARDARRAENG